MGVHYGRQSRRASWKCGCALMAGALMAPALAHHSGAMFDDKVSVTLNGTVRQFQWTNPHCWIQVVVPDKSGPVEWSVEMGSPSQLFHGGWNPKTVRVGDAIVVVVHPMRDGTKGGLFVSATRGDGTPFGAVAR
ncbi:MAG: hypothetical protein JSR67_15165 [Proteobacteria bacterium]|nr:hypothetical protein [Pseudomonadota bacterium]